MSRTGCVPVLVPSLDHGSQPIFGVQAPKNTRSPTAVRPVETYPSTGSCISIGGLLPSAANREFRSPPSLIQYSVLMPHTRYPTPGPTLYVRTVVPAVPPVRQIHWVFDASSARNQACPAWNTNELACEPGFADGVTAATGGVTPRCPATATVAASSSEPTTAAATAAALLNVMRLNPEG